MVLEHRGNRLKKESSMFCRLIIALSFAGITYTDFLQLAQWCEPLEIYHIKTTQISGYSCGFNALFNACNLERIMGIPNPHNNFSSFQAVCASYMAAHAPGQTTRQALNNKQTMQLSNHLGLQAASYFTRHKGYVAPFIDHVSVKFPKGTSQAQIQQLMEQKRIQMERDVVQELQKFSFEVPTPYCIHFMCGISTKKHVILITLIVTKEKRILCVCDNLNEHYLQSDLEEFLLFFASTFSVSPRSSQPFYVFPQRWPGIR